jgi:protoheme IX farnesyltransferase
MAADRTLAPLAEAFVERRRWTAHVPLSDYWAITKPEVNFLIVITTFAGFYLGRATAHQYFPLLLAVNAMLGALLVASGAGALNQYTERRFDAQMRRTARRPLAAGRLNPSAVFWFGAFLSTAGSIYLAVAVNRFASLLAMFTLFSYLFVYTPLKRKTPLCTLVGAVPGAMPPLIGWAAACGDLTLEAGTLFLVIFLWQFPHFMAIAWMYRDDYYRAGYKVLPRGHAGARFATLQTVLPLLLLTSLSVLPGMTGQLKIIYCVGALILSLGFFYYGMQFALHKSSATARRLLAASIIYLPLLFVLMILVNG